MFSNRIRLGILSLSVSIISLFYLFPKASALGINDLKDVSPRDPKIGIYLDLLNNEAMTLDKSGNFRPNETINRAAFFKIALSYLGYKPSKTFNYFTGYLDVPEESWFAPYVKKALEMRVIENKLNDNFYPADLLNRQEALLLTMRIYGLPTPYRELTAKDLYSDIRITHPLASIYAGAKSQNIYFENDQENFKPNLVLTRGDAADLLFKAKLATDSLPAEQHYQPSVIANPGFSLTEEEAQLLRNEKFGIFLDTWNKINQQFIYNETLTENKLVYGAISGMVNSLNDPYSTFNSPNSDGYTFIYIPENYEGIGAIIEQIDNQFVIQSTITNSPAYRAGLKSKDVILEINGKNLEGLSYDQATSLIKGKAGTVVKLKVKRENTILTFEITREKITIEAVQYSIIASGINYVRIDQFTENSGSEFQKITEKIQQTGQKKLIIDLRNNPGGYLSSTQTILDHFLTNGQIEFVVVDKNYQQSNYISSGSGELKDYRTVVLVNEGSASASEIFAGALQDHKIARIIGTKTFGKGSVQEITNYYDNSSLKLTIAKWLTPMLRDINHLGITPDETVTISDEQKQLGKDPQLEAAINYLQ